MIKTLKSDENKGSWKGVGTTGYLKQEAGPGPNPFPTCLQHPESLSQPAFPEAHPGPEGNTASDSSHSSSMGRVKNPSPELAKQMNTQ